MLVVGVRGHVEHARGDAEPAQREAEADGAAVEVERRVRRRLRRGGREQEEDETAREGERPRRTEHG